MGTPQSIRRLGFRKWYERELLQSHAHLVLLVLAALGLLGCAETYTRRLAFDDQLQIVAAALASAAIGVFALRRYLYLLNHAEFVAGQATCPVCNTYARWDLEAERSGEARLHAHCRHCQHRWQIDV